MTFSSDLERFAKKVERRSRDLFVGATLEVQRSIVEGSEITGAPGQPVDTGYLKGSWTPDYTGKWSWKTSTKVAYAPVIEENQRGAYDPSGTTAPKDQGGTNRYGPSTVGGPHSVRLTRGGWPRIVEVVRKRVAR